MNTNTEMTPKAASVVLERVARMLDEIIVGAGGTGPATLAEHDINDVEILEIVARRLTASVKRAR